MMKGLRAPLVMAVLLVLSGCQSWTVRDIDSLPPTAALPAQSEQGRVEARYFDDVSGSRVSALTALTRFPDNPDDVVQLNRLEGPVNRSNNYGTLVRGYITPPSDGRYRFFVSGDDETQFFFSTNASPGDAVMVASVPSSMQPNQFNSFSSQTSPYFELVRGQKYYFEIRHKEGYGSDHYSVAWEGPGIAQSVVDGQHLYSYAQGSSLYPDDELSTQGYALGYRIGFFDGSKDLPFNPQYTPLDEDQDGLYDNWEVYHGLNPSDPSDASSDQDDDFLTAYDEFWIGAAPNNPDTDGDGIPDGVEFAFGLDPLNSADALEDLDGDGVSNLDEYLAGTDISDPADFPQTLIEYVPGAIGQYFAGGNFDRFVTARTDSGLSFDWGSGSPAEGVPQNVFTVRWFTQFNPPHNSGSREYEFRIRRDDGVRLYVENNRVLNAWTGGSTTAVYTASYSFEAGAFYPITIEYREGYGSANIQVDIVDQATGAVLRAEDVLLTQPLGAKVSPDSDGDGIPDIWELAYGLNPAADDGQSIQNPQGISALQAFQQGLSPWTLEDVGTWDGQIVTANPEPPSQGVPPVAELAPPQSVTLSWVAPSTRVDGSSISLSEIESYEISYGQNRANLEQIERVPGGTTSFTFEGLIPGTWYFRVRAVDSTGLRSAPSEIVSYVASANN